MDIAELLTPERIASGMRAYSKRRVLELLAELLAKDSTAKNQALNRSQILDGLLARESLGGTGLGQGIALPHSRLQNAQRVVGAFLQLERGISFDALDRMDVDLFFALVVPDQATDEYLVILSHLAQMFSDTELCQRLRKARGAGALHEILIHWQPLDEMR